MKLVWASHELEQVHIDHAQYQRLNDQVYLTLGQTFIPISQELPPDVAEIRPKGRFVMSVATAKSIADMLHRNFGGGKEGEE